MKVYWILLKTNFRKHYVIREIWKNKRRKYSDVFVSQDSFINKTPWHPDTSLLQMCVAEQLNFLKLFPFFKTYLIFVFPVSLWDVFAFVYVFMCACLEPTDNSVGVRNWSYSQFWATNLVLETEITVLSGQAKFPASHLYL